MPFQSFFPFFFMSGHVSSSSCRVGPLELDGWDVSHLYETVEKPFSTATGDQEHFETRSTVPRGILYD